MKNCENAYLVYMATSLSHCMESGRRILSLFVSDQLKIQTQDTAAFCYVLGLAKETVLSCDSSVTSTLENRNCVSTEYL